jgi:SAM-dependent methyltransferase
MGLPSRDPLAETTWSAPGTVAGFARATPNEVLLAFARELQRHRAKQALDLGCGAGRNAVPLARLGWDVAGTDLSWPMLSAAAERAAMEQVGHRVQLIDELAAAGFVPDPAVPLTQYNRRRAASLHRGGPPVIYEAAFRRVGRG